MPWLVASMRMIGRSLKGASAAGGTITTPGKLLHLVSWRDTAAVDGWQPRASLPDVRHRRVRVIRDYGLADRREAPQFYPDVARRTGGG